MANQSCKIFIGFSEIAGYYSGLSEGLQRLGVPHSVCFKKENKFQYELRSSSGILNRLFVYFFRVIYGESRPFWKKLFIYLVFSIPYHISQILFFIETALKHDVFIFSCGGGFFANHYFDRKILKLLNKKIIEIFHGSDSRPLYFGVAGSRLSPAQLKKLVFKQKRRIKKLGRTASYIIDSEPTSQFHEKSIVKYQMIGAPSQNKEVKSEKICEAASLRILHSPSNPEIKGSALIREVIRELKLEHDFEYVEVSNVSHKTVIEEIEKCSFVINQMYSDTLMSGLDAEAAFQGKLSIVGGYELQKNFDSFPSGMAPPTLFVYPNKSSLKSTLQELIQNKSLFRDRGESLLNYVQSKWSNTQVAQNFLILIEGNAPEEWFFDPYKVSYIYGCGISRKTRNESVSKLIHSFGVESLMLDDKAPLRDLLMADIE